MSVPLHFEELSKKGGVMLSSTSPAGRYLDGDDKSSIVASMVAVSSPRVVKLKSNSAKVSCEAVAEQDGDADIWVINVSIL